MGLLLLEGVVGGLALVAAGLYLFVPRRRRQAASLPTSSPAERPFDWSDRILVDALKAPNRVERRQVIADGIATRRAARGR